MVLQSEEMQTIDLRAAAGGVEASLPLTLTEESCPPKDISEDTVKLSLGDDQTPGEWKDSWYTTPGANQEGRVADVQNELTVALLIGTTYRPDGGDYWLWSQTTDVTEVIVRRHYPVRVLRDA
jgi:hypothetical protein